MDGAELRELQNTFSGVSKKCRCLRNICFVLVAVTAIVWVLLLASAFLLEKNTEAILPKLLYMSTYGFVIIALLLIFWKTFSDVVEGSSPFTLKQVSRFRYVALLLVLLAVVDAILSVSFSYSFDFAGVPFQALGSNTVAYPVVNINVGAIFFSAIFYGLSVLFRYGVLLQRLTDETE